DGIRDFHVTGVQTCALPIFDAHAPLFGGVDQEQPAERPPRLSAEARLRFLFDNGDAFPCVNELSRSYQAGEPRTHDDGIRFHRSVLRHPGRPPCLTRPRCSMLSPQLRAAPLLAVESGSPTYSLPVRRGYFYRDDV